MLRSDITRSVSLASFVPGVTRMPSWLDSAFAALKLPVAPTPSS